jgi:predicted Zn-dependent protease
VTQDAAAGPRPGGRGHGARSAAALAAFALAAAACSDGRPNTCFDSNASSYGFAVGGDTTLVFHWPASRMPVRAYAEPTGATAADVATGLQTWANGFHCREASFTIVADSAQADIIVRPVATLPPQPTRAISVGADSAGACTGRTDGTFDSSLTLTGPVRSYIAPIPGKDSTALAGCFRMTTTHELGHALGILAHSTDPGDIMYTTPRRSTLSANDRYTLQQLYHTTPTIKPAPRTP